MVKLLALDIKGISLQLFCCQLREILQNSSFKKHRVTASVPMQKCILVKIDSSIKWCPMIYRKFTLHKKWSFPLRNSPVNVTKSIGNCGFGHSYWRNTYWRTSFIAQCLKSSITLTNIFWPMYLLAHLCKLAIFFIYNNCNILSALQTIHYTSGLLTFLTQTYMIILPINKKLQALQKLRQM